jgi:hypothetical protein
MKRRAFLAFSAASGATIALGTHHAMAFENEERESASIGEKLYASMI